MREHGASYEIEPTQRKQDKVEVLSEKLSRATGAVLLDYRGLSVTEVSELRVKLQEQDADFHVVKNTLLKIAAEQNQQDFGAMLEGPTALAIMYGEPVGPAKVFNEYLRDHKNVTLKGGVLKGRLITPENVTALAKIPPREVLIAQLLASAQGPITGLVGTLSSVLSSFVFTLQAVADQKNASA